MIQIERKSIEGSLILRFGLPIDWTKVNSFHHWLKCNLDKTQYAITPSLYGGETLKFNITEKSELTDEEVEYLKETEGESLRKIVGQLTDEDFILITAYSSKEEYNKDKRTKEELIALKSLLEKNEIEFENIQNKTYIELTPKGRYRYLKNHQIQVIKRFKSRLERKGFDPTLVDDEYLMYIAKERLDISEESFNKYCEHKGIAYPKNVSYVKRFDSIRYSYLLGLDEEALEKTDLLLSSDDKDTSICLVDVRIFGINAKIIEGHQLIKWPTDEDKIKEVTEDNTFYSNKVGERLLRETIDEILYNYPKLVIEKRDTAEGTTYTVRGIISVDEWEEEHIITFNPAYLKKKQEKELNEDQQTLKLK